MSSFYWSKYGLAYRQSGSNTGLKNILRMCRPEAAIENVCIVTQRLQEYKADKHLYSIVARPGIAILPYPVRKNIKKYTLIKEMHTSADKRSAQSATIFRGPLWVGNF